MREEEENEKNGGPMMINNYKMFSQPKYIYPVTFRISIRRFTAFEWEKDAHKKDNQNSKNCVSIAIKCLFVEKNRKKKKKHRQHWLGESLSTVRMGGDRG